MQEDQCAEGHPQHQLPPVVRNVALHLVRGHSCLLVPPRRRLGSRGTSANGRPIDTSDPCAQRPPARSPPSRERSAFRRGRHGRDDNVTAIGTAESAMKIATFNVNGITSRLPRLLDWLGRESPDIACLQELKAADEGFPIAAIRDAGYGAIWHGQRSWNGVAILAKGADPVERRRGLPGDPDDCHSRYIEASVRDIVVASIYLPNGNPQPGPKFDYKLAWFQRLIEHSQGLYEAQRPAVLAGDFNVVPTDFDIYDP